jgi:SAM-dependent methyltransferase
MSAQNAWQDASGQRWAELQAQTDVQLEPLGLAALQRVQPTPPERVLDVGCGAGQTSLYLARCVAPAGSVVGLDISEPLLARAQQRAQAEQHPNLTFVLGDAATQMFEEPFDVIFSRFGVMFFDDAVAAFKNLLRALRSGGRLGFVCWQARERNPWAELTLAAAQRVFPNQPIPALLEPGQPGPFYFADPQFVRHLLGEAGFNQIEIVPHEQQVQVGGARTLAEALDYLLKIGPAARMFADADRSLEPRLREELASVLQPYASERGVWMPSSTHLVNARKP